MPAALEVTDAEHCPGPRAGLKPRLPAGQHCSVAGTASACSASIACGQQFMSWFLHFLSVFLVMAWGEGGTVENGCRGWVVATRTGELSEAPASWLHPGSVLAVVTAGEVTWQVCDFSV